MTDELLPFTDADLFYRDLLADCVSSALASQWRARAELFRLARPRVGDFHGEATHEALSARWRRLTALAEACEAKAALMDSADASAVVPELADFPIWDAA